MKVRRCRLPGRLRSPLYQVNVEEPLHLFSKWVVVGCPKQVRQTFSPNLTLFCPIPIQYVPTKKHAFGYFYCAKLKNVPIFVHGNRILLKTRTLQYGSMRKQCPTVSDSFKDLPFSV